MANGPMAMPKLRKAPSTCCGVAPSSSRNSASRILEDHAVADEAVAHADHHRDLFQLLADSHRGGQHLVAGLRAAYHFEQAHDVGRAEEMQAHHVLGAPGECGDLVQVQRRGIAGEDGARLADRIEPLEDLALDVHLLEHRLDHQVDVRRAA